MHGVTAAAVIMTVVLYPSDYLKFQESYQTRVVNMCIYTPGRVYSLFNGWHTRLYILLAQLHV
jgi:hypothetical protein